MNQNYNSFLDFAEDEPLAGYFAYQDQWRTPSQKKYFQGQFQEIQNEYLGRLGQQIRGGGEGKLHFADFLSQIPWAQRFAGLPPSQRGENTSLFNPWTRYMF